MKTTCKPQLNGLKTPPQIHCSGCSALTTLEKPHGLPDVQRAINQFPYTFGCKKPAPRNPWNQRPQSAPTKNNGGTDE